jgi:acyl-homoserine-lactone acylase
MADRLLDDLLPLAREEGSEKARRAARVLEAWDRETDADSRGAVLFLHWARALYDQTRGDPWAEDWTLEAPMATPDGLETPDLALRLLEAAADTTVTRHGAMDVAFGDVHRLRRDSLDLPANGHGDPLGIFRAAWYQRAGEEFTYELTGGDSFVLAVEFGDSIRARAVLGCGNSTQPDSPHRTDQLDLFSEKGMRPVWRTRGEVEANLSHRTLWPLPTGG